MGHLGESGVACAGCRVRSGGVPHYCPAPVLSLLLPELCRTRSSLQSGDCVLTPTPMEERSLPVSFPWNTLIIRFCGASGQTDMIVPFQWEEVTASTFPTKN
jgi:hypothetical protein